MASITIRKLDEMLKRKLRVRAARHGRSMEEEARQILRAGLTEKTQKPKNFYEAIRRHIAPLGGRTGDPSPWADARTAAL